MSAPTGPAPMTSAFFGRDAESLMLVVSEVVERQACQCWCCQDMYVIAICSRHEMDATDSWPGTTSTESNAAAAHVTSTAARYKFQNC